MAAGAWDPTTALMSTVGSVFGGKFVHPHKLNPYRQRPKTRAQREAESKEGWTALRAGLKAIAGGRR